MGLVKVWLGEPEVAIERVERALRLSPHDPHAFNMKSVIAYAHFASARYAEALSWAESALLARPDHGSALRVLAASCAMTKRREKAGKAMAHLRELDPELRISNLQDRIPLQKEEDFNRLVEGLREAGLPE